MYYSLANRDIEREVVPLAKDQGLAILPWSPLGGRIALGQVRSRTARARGRRRSTFDFPPVDRPRVKAVIEALREVSRATGLSVPRIALAWLLTRPFVTSVIIGAKTPEQLADNLGASDVTLDAEHVARLDAASALAPEYPGWMVERQNQNRRPETAV